jgi:hypothetical protein
MDSIPGLDLLLGFAITIAGLVIAALIRSIDLDDLGSTVSAAVVLTVIGWVASWVVPMIMAESAGSMRAPSWRPYALMFGGIYVLNIIALGITSLFVDGLKIRGFVGLLAAALVVTVADHSVQLIQVVRVMLG